MEVRINSYKRNPRTSIPYFRLVHMVVKKEIPVSILYIRLIHLVLTRLYRDL